MYAYLKTVEDVLEYQSDNGSIEAVSTLSGGIDSTTTAYIATKEYGEHCLFLYIDYGSKVAASEIEASRKTAEALDMPFLVVQFKDFMKVNKSFLMGNNAVEAERGLQFWSEGRNAMLALMAANVASTIGCGYVYLSISASDSDGDYVDTDEAFIDAVNLMIRHSFRNRVRVGSILLDENLSKCEVIARGSALGVSWVGQTHSCSSSTTVCCNYSTCESCMHRLAGFVLNEQPDPFDPMKGSLEEHFEIIKKVNPRWGYATLDEMRSDLRSITMSV